LNVCHDHASAPIADRSDRRIEWTSWKRVRSGLPAIGEMQTRVRVDHAASSTLGKSSPLAISGHAHRGLSISAATEFGEHALVTAGAFHRVAVQRAMFASGIFRFRSTRVFESPPAVNELPVELPAGTTAALADGCIDSSAHRFAPSRCAQRMSQSGRRRRAAGGHLIVVGEPGP